MNILGRQVMFLRKPGVHVSRLAGVLPRIRAIRDECNWPLSSGAATQQRRERVRTAQRHIVYHPFRPRVRVPFAAETNLVAATRCLARGALFRRTRLRVAAALAPEERWVCRIVRRLAIKSGGSAWPSIRSSVLTVG